MKLKTPFNFFQIIFKNMFVWTEGDGVAFQTGSLSWNLDKVVGEKTTQVGLCLASLGFALHCHTFPSPIKSESGPALKSHLWIVGYYKLAHRLPSHSWDHFVSMPALLLTPLSKIRLSLRMYRWNASAVWKQLIRMQVTTGACCASKLLLIVQPSVRQPGQKSQDAVTGSVLKLLAHFFKCCSQYWVAP